MLRMIAPEGAAMFLGGKFGHSIRDAGRNLLRYFIDIHVTSGWRRYVIVPKTEKIVSNLLACRDGIALPCHSSS